jgi:hypothetical protein
MEAIMKARMAHRLLAALALPIALSLAAAAPASAHCDGMDGPVVAAGKIALETGDVRHALVWVLDEGEEEVRQAFERAVGVRMLGEPARELADTYFFETLVRIHREGEGEPFTGLKPAGRDLGKIIPAADVALETGSLDSLERLLLEHFRNELRHRFEAAQAVRSFAPTDIAAGRAYVEAYVALLHYVEALHGVLSGHGHDGAPSAHGH